MRDREWMAMIGGVGCSLLLLLLTLAGRSWEESRGAVTTSGKAGVPGKIALTFDDGPHPYYTQQLLDGLAERDVQVSFFVTGQNAREYPELILRMQKEGHLIGNHTYYHTQLTASNSAEFAEEILFTNETLREITGQETCYIRPPFGSWDKKYEEQLNMFPVLWTVDPLDWCRQDVSGIVQDVLCDIGENDIILMHDQYKSSVTAALQIVDRLLEAGYEFVTVEEIMFD